jgi:hypothetical protein
MPSKKPLIALRISDDLYDKIRSSAEAEGRTMTNFLDFYLRRALLPVNTVSNNTSAMTLGDLRRAGRQVDIEDAIVAAVKRGPVKAAKHK